MIRQDEIKDELAEVIRGQQEAAGIVDHPDIRAEEILSYLHSQGVVIKVNRELPESLYHEEEHLDPKWVEEAVKNDMLKAGFVAVEPLIKEVMPSVRV